MTTRSTAAVAFLTAALSGFAAFRAIPLARACMVATPWDTGGTFDVDLGTVWESSGSGASVPEEKAAWAASATLSMPERRLDFADGTHLDWQGAGQ